MNYNEIPTSIKDELKSYIDENINNYDSFEDIHYKLFNEDYYIIGYYQCNEWLKEHNISVFEGIEICQNYEKDKFGECQIYDNSEKLVNMLVCIYGEIILNELEIS